MSLLHGLPDRIGGLPRAGRHAVGKVGAEAKPALRWGLGQAFPRMVMQRSARRGDLQGRLILASTHPSSQEVDRLVEEIRGLGPLHRGAFSYMTADHAVVREVLTGNHLSAGLRTGTTLMDRVYDWSTSEYFHPVEPPSLLATEPPDHTRYRKLVTRVFTNRAVKRLRDRTEEIATELLDDLEARGTDDPVDLVATYCGLLPVTVISEILGVPVEERERVLELGSGVAPSLDVGLSWREFRDVEHSLVEFDRWLTDHLATLRRDPGDNLLSQLVTAREDGVGLTDLELRATAGLVLAAGFETTVNLLGNGIALLCRHPGQLERLRQQPELWPNAVDEVLRFDPPVMMTGRMATEEVEVAGTRIPAGSAVTTLLIGANRDPKVFADPMRFDVARENARDHLAFSAGRHYCLGAQLARMEGEVGLRAIFDRFPELTLAPGSRRRSTRILRGYEALPANLTAG